MLCRGDIESALTSAFQRMQADLISASEADGISLIHAGTTAVCILRQIHSSVVWVACVGDSRVIHLCGDGRVSFSTNDHKPSNPVERDRVIKNGCEISVSIAENGEELEKIVLHSELFEKRRASMECKIELHWTIGVIFCCTCCGLALTKCVEGERGRAPELGFTRSLGDLMQLGRNKNPNAPQIDLLTDPSRYKSYGVIAEPEIFKLEKAIIGSILHRLELWKFEAFFFSPRRNWKMVQATSYWPAMACGNFWPMRMLQSWRIAAGIARLPIGIQKSWEFSKHDIEMNSCLFFSNKKTKRWPLGWMDGVLGAVSLGDKQGCLQQGMAKDSIVREVAKVWILVLNCPVVDLSLQHRWLEQSGRRGTEGTIA